MGAWWQLQKPETAEIANFAECVAAGNPVMESYPRQCRANGKTFVENIGNEPEKTDLIRLATPRPNQIIKSPLHIAGEARGSWFFEGSFPITLADGNGKIIGHGIATAGSDWMTEEFVPFIATIEFADPTYKNTGSLILKKDNPSGLPEHDDALEIPILFEIEKQSGNTGIPPFDSGVTGKVFLGPVCPVMRDPPDPNCADKPYQTTVQIIKKGGIADAPLMTAKTDINGQFKFLLPAGEYELQAVGRSPLPRCETKTIIIKQGTILETNLACDTGIR